MKDLRSPSASNPLIVALSILTTAIVAFLAGSLLQINANPDANLQPTVAACELVGPEEIQNCCGDWARETGAASILCTGQWQLQDGQCSWQCGE